MNRIFSWLGWSGFSFLFFSILAGIVIALAAPEWLDEATNNYDEQLNMLVLIIMFFSFSLTAVMVFFEKLPGSRRKRECPYCLEYILKDAIICKHCKSTIKTRNESEVIVVGEE